jgi:hypothetical protein
MPILTLQKSMRRLGRIRMGSKSTKTVTRNGKEVEVEFPNKLETWRITSMSKDLLDAAAVIYGGEVTEWEGSPSGKQWELFTEASALDVIIPPGDMAFSQWFELWSGGGCQRRCDGQTEIISDQACMCPADPELRIEEAGKGRACKPTTRLFVIQPHLPDVGLWHFESHGFYAATEIPGTINIIRTAAANGTLIPARLRIEQRSVKRDGKTKNFAVPVIELPTLTTHSLMTGEIVGGAQLGAGAVGEIGPGVPDLGAGGDNPVASASDTSQEPPVRPVVERDAQKDAQRLHKYLGSMGLAKDDQEAIIFCASKGRTIHSSDLTQAELSQAQIIGENIRDGKRTLEAVHQVVADALSAKAASPEGGRPLPSAGSGDGSNFRRAILGKAKKLGLDADALDAVCRGSVGKPFAEIATIDEGNTMLAALDGKQGALL